jgi:DNA-binding SARP family transcriptional activator
VSTQAGALVTDVVESHDQLRVLGPFALFSDGQPLELPLQAQRVLGYLAVVRPAQSRSVLAGSLWGDVSEDRAMATLRNTLWRIRKAKRTLVRTSRDSISISSNLWIDLTYTRRCAAAIEAGELIITPQRDGSQQPIGADAELIDMLDSDLLTGWDEDWLQIERERLRQLRIHALESLAEALIQKERHAPAIQAALAAVRAEPLRESAQVMLIKAHLSEGNASEAVRQFESYRRLLADELGLSPSPRVASLIPAVGHGQRPSQSAVRARGPLVSPSSRP